LDTQGEKDARSQRGSDDDTQVIQHLTASKRPWELCFSHNIVQKNQESRIDKGITGTQEHQDQEGTA
jgi:hypothetical protein